MMDEISTKISTLIDRDNKPRLDFFLMGQKSNRNNSIRIWDHNKEDDFIQPTILKTIIDTKIIKHIKECIVGP